MQTSPNPVTASLASTNLPTNQLGTGVSTQTSLNTVTGGSLSTNAPTSQSGTVVSTLTSPNTVTGGSLSTNVPTSQSGTAVPTQTSPNTVTGTALSTNAPTTQSGTGVSTQAYSSTATGGSTSTNLPTTQSGTVVSTQTSVNTATGSASSTNLPATQTGTTNLATSNLASAATGTITLPSTVQTSFSQISSQANTVSSATLATGTATSAAVSQTVSSISNPTNATSTFSSASTVAQNTASTYAATLTTTFPPTVIVYTDFRVPNNSVFNPNNSIDTERIRQSLIEIVNLGFTCKANSSNPNCTSTGRRRRATTSLPYDVTIIPPISLVSTDGNGTKGYRVNYVVTSTSDNNTVPATTVKSAVSVLPASRTQTVANFTVQGSFIQSASFVDTSSSATILATAATTGSATDGGTAATVPTTTTAGTDYQMYTDFKSYSNSFDPNNATHTEDLQKRLSDVINLGFNCLTNSSIAQCTSSSRRRRATSNYAAQIIGKVSQSSDSAADPKTFRANYNVRNLASNSLVSAVDVKNAVDKVPTDQQSILLGFKVVGSFVNGPSIPNTTLATGTPDNRLWIIGAVLGPVAFVVLLICLAVFLHFKCRRRESGESMAQAVFNAPQATPRAANYRVVTSEPLREQTETLNSTRGLALNDPSIGNATSTRRLSPNEFSKISTNTPQYPASASVPMQDIRHQNDVERWRNKLRLQEKFEQRYGDPLNDLDQFQNSSLPRRTSPTTKRPMTYQYNNQGFEPDLSHGSIRGLDELNLLEPSPSNYGTQRSTRTPETEAGRTKLHRLLDEVLDQAEPNQMYNPNPQRVTRHDLLQQPHIHSTYPNNERFRHSPIIPRVAERPDPAISRYNYNPYEVGDRIHDLEGALPVYSTDDNDSRKFNMQPPYRSTSPLFYSGYPQRPGDRGGQRQHEFSDDVVYIDTMPKTHNDARVSVPSTWINDNENSDRAFHLNSSDLNRRNNYQDAYALAKQSVLTTRNMMSVIHDDLQHIISDPLNESHYV